MNEKVTVSKEIAEEIKVMRLHWSDEQIVKLYLTDREWLNNREHVDQLMLDDLISALYIGYEVEQTPEDKVRDYYNGLRNSLNSNPTMERAQDEWRAEMDGIEKTLDLLNIKIEGVNG